MADGDHEGFDTVSDHVTGISRHLNREKEYKRFDTFYEFIEVLSLCSSENN